MSFEEIAAQRQLRSAGPRLGELQWDVEPDPYQRRKVPPGVPFEAFVPLMPRRGLEPSLVNSLFDSLADRPVERALVAWDAVRGSLFGEDDGPVVQRMATEISPLKRLGSPVSVAVPRERLPMLVDAVRASSDTSSVGNDFDTFPSLAGVLALSANAAPDHITAINDHAKLLAYAHLPSLALAFLQLAWDRFAEPSTLDLMLELGLDHGMVAGFPVLSGQDERSIQQQAYIALRMTSYEYNVVAGARVLEVLENLPAVQQWNAPSWILANAEHAILQNQQLDTPTKQIIESVGTSRSRHATDGWRYAEFVKRAMDIQARGDAASNVDDFTVKFGNNARLWGHAAHREDARAELLTLLSRELKFSSHDPDVWRAVSILVTDGLEIDNAIVERLTSQLLTAYA